MIQVIRYTQGDSTMLRKSGSWMQAEPIYYRFGRDEIAARLRQAILAAEEGFTADDLVALDAGRLPESKLRALFGSFVLARSFVGSSPHIGYR